MMKFKIKKIIAILFAIVLVCYIAVVFLIEMKSDLPLQCKINVVAGSQINGYVELDFINDNSFPITIYNNKIYAIMVNRSTKMLNEELKQIVSIDTVYLKRGINYNSDKFIIQSNSSKTFRIVGSKNLNFLNCKLLYYDFLKLSTINIFNLFNDKKINETTKENQIGKLSIVPQYSTWTEEFREEEIKMEIDNDGLD